MRILSIQSRVAFGYAGNSAAVFPLQRLGHEVVAVDTVHFAHHTGHGPARGPLHTPAEVTEVLDGLEAVGVLGGVDAVLTGYVGDPASGAVVLDAVARVRAASPHATWTCDPVMGDYGRGMFVRTGIPEWFRDEVVPHTDVLTPNHYELGFLAGRPVDTLAQVRDAVDVLRERGPRTVLVTSVLHDALPAGTVATLVVADEGAWVVSTPLLDVTTAGTGDLTAALFTAHLPAGPEAALVRTVASVHAVLAATQPGAKEIALLAAQDAIASPPDGLLAERLR